MTPEKSVSERYHEARAAQKDDGQLRTDLYFAAGVLLGGGFPGGAAAVETAFRRLFPDADFPVIV